MTRSLIDGVTAGRDAMGVYWLEAEEAVAGAIAGSEGRGVHDWSSLSMPGVQKAELVALWAVLRSAPGDFEAATGDVLASNTVQGTSVGRVTPEFVRRLAALEAPDIERTTAEWAKFGGLAERPAEYAGVVLRELASFARSISDEGTVLQVTDDQ
jgi:hypothetical protein